MTEKRARGERFAPGFIRRRIAVMVFHHPEGITERDVRDALREKYGVYNKGVVVEHLGNLEKGRILVKRAEEGKENIWIPNADSPDKIFEFYAEIVKENTPKFATSAFLSEHMQRLIEAQQLHHNFLKHFGMGEDGEILKEVEPDLMRVFSEGVKISPTALRYINENLPEVNIATSLILSGKTDYDKGGLNIRKVALAALISCLLIDMGKYYLLRKRISAFFGDPSIRDIIQTHLGWTLNEERIGEIVNIYGFSGTWRSLNVIPSEQ